MFMLQFSHIQNPSTPEKKTSSAKCWLTFLANKKVQTIEFMNNQNFKEFSKFLNILKNIIKKMLMNMQIYARYYI